MFHRSMFVTFFFLILVSPKVTSAAPERLHFCGPGQRSIDPSAIRDFIQSNQGFRNLVVMPKLSPMHHTFMKQFHEVPNALFPNLEQTGVCSVATQDQWVVNEQFIIDFHLLLYQILASDASPFKDLMKVVLNHPQVFARFLIIAFDLLPPSERAMLMTQGTLTTNFYQKLRVLLSMLVPEPLPSMDVVNLIVDATQSGMNATFACIGRGVGGGTAPSCSSNSTNPIIASNEILLCNLQQNQELRACIASLGAVVQVAAEAAPILNPSSGQQPASPLETAFQECGSFSSPRIQSAVNYYNAQSVIPPVVTAPAFPPPTGQPTLQATSDYIDYMSGRVVARCLELTQSVMPSGQLPNFQQLPGCSLQSPTGVLNPAQCSSSIAQASRDYIASMQAATSAAALSCRNESEAAFQNALCMSLASSITDYSATINAPTTALPMRIPIYIPGCPRREREVVFTNLSKSRVPLRNHEIPPPAGVENPPPQMLDVMHSILDTMKVTPTFNPTENIRNNPLVMDLNVRRTLVGDTLISRFTNPFGYFVDGAPGAARLRPVMNPETLVALTNGSVLYLDRCDAGEVMNLMGSEGSFIQFSEVASRARERISQHGWTLRSPQDFPFERHPNWPSFVNTFLSVPDRHLDWAASGGVNWGGEKIIELIPPTGFISPYPAHGLLKDVSRMIADVSNNQLSQEALFDGIQGGLLQSLGPRGRVPGLNISLAQGASSGYESENVPTNILALINNALSWVTGFPTISVNPNFHGKVAPFAEYSAVATVLGYFNNMNRMDYNNLGNTILSNLLLNGLNDLMMLMGNLAIALTEGTFRNIGDQLGVLWQVLTGQVSFIEGIVLSFERMVDNFVTAIVVQLFDVVADLHYGGGSAHRTAEGWGNIQNIDSPYLRSMSLEMKIPWLAMYFTSHRIDNQRPAIENAPNLLVAILQRLKGRIREQGLMRFYEENFAPLSEEQSRDLASPNSRLLENRWVIGQIMLLLKDGLRVTDKSDLLGRFLSEETHFARSYASFLHQPNTAWWYSSRATRPSHSVNYDGSLHGIEGELYDSRILHYLPPITLPDPKGVGLPHSVTQLQVPWVIDPEGILTTGKLIRVALSHIQDSALTGSVGTEGCGTWDPLFARDPIHPDSVQFWLCQLEKGNAIAPVQDAKGNNIYNADHFMWCTASKFFRDFLDFVPRDGQPADLISRVCSEVIPGFNETKPGGAMLGMLNAMNLFSNPHDTDVADQAEKVNARSIALASGLQRLLAHLLAGVTHDLRGTCGPAVGSSGRNSYLLNMKHPYPIPEIVNSDGARPWYADPDVLNDRGCQEPFLGVSLAKLQYNALSLHWFNGREPYSVNAQGEKTMTFLNW